MDSREVLKQMFEPYVDPEAENYEFTKEKIFSKGFSFQVDLRDFLMECEDWSEANFIEFFFNYISTAPAKYSRGIRNHFKISLFKDENYQLVMKTKNRILIRDLNCDTFLGFKHSSICKLFSWQDRIKSTPLLIDVQITGRDFPESGLREEWEEYESIKSASKYLITLENSVKNQIKNTLLSKHRYNYLSERSKLYSLVRGDNYRLWATTRLVLGTMRSVLEIKFFLDEFLDIKDNDMLKFKADKRMKTFLEKLNSLRENLRVIKDRVHYKLGWAKRIKLILGKK